MHVTTHAGLLVQLLEDAGLRAQVSLLAQEPAGQDIVVWPYAATPDAARRNAGPAVAAGDAAVRGEAPWITHALLIPATLEAYDRACAQLLAQPVVQGPKGRALVLVEALSPAELAALLQAAGLPMRVTLPVSVRQADGGDPR